MFESASMQGLGFSNQTQEGLIEAALIGSYSHGALLGLFSFEKLNSNSSELEINLFEAGGSVGYDYPVGFSIEI